MPRFLRGHLLIRIPLVILLATITYASLKQLEHSSWQKRKKVEMDSCPLKGFGDMIWTDKIVLSKNKAGEWYLRIKARNGRVLFTSESYSTRAKAVQTAKGIKARHDRFKITEEGQ